MPTIAAVGSAQDLDGRQAGAQAARIALDELGGQPVQFGYLLASGQFEVESVMNGVASLLGNTPVFGHSTAGFIEPSEAVGGRSRMVKVLLFAGQEMQARADWWPGFGDSSRGTARKLVSELDPGLSMGDLLLLAGDGLRADGSLLGLMLGEGAYPMAGVLASASESSKVTYQLGGATAGSGGLAAAWLSGAFASGIGQAHGWVAAGPNMKITHVRDRFLRTLDDRPAPEVYAELLGGTAEDWIRPPLNRLVRMYPLGLEPADGKSLTLLSPIAFEPDGSLRLNASPDEGRLGYLMTGSPEVCLQAARQAAERAVEDLGGVAPFAALVFADLAWSYLFEGQPGAVASSVRQVLGELPFIGGYTLGHLRRPSAGAAPELRQGEIMVVVLGER
jgi:hypothetical protein